jgi:hypothetical protein
MSALQKTVRDLIELFRYMFAEDKALLRRIDSAYEETLIEELNLIPKEFEAYVMNYVDILQKAYGCFDIVRFYECIREYDNAAFPTLFVNSYKAFTNGLTKLTISKANKARVMNMVGKFEPLFTCIDHVINDTKSSFEKLAKRASGNTFDDLL